MERRLCQLCFFGPVHGKRGYGAGALPLGQTFDHLNRGSKNPISLSGQKGFRWYTECWPGGYRNSSHPGRCRMNYLYSGTKALWTQTNRNATLRGEAQIASSRSVLSLKECVAMIMFRKLVLVGAAACLPLTQNSRAAENTKPGDAPVPVGVGAAVSCHGIENVPMTADQEQALPLQVVATLKCGDEVAVLADDEGYTAKIRTADGKTGFVARMYLAKAAQAAKPATAARTPTPLAQNAVVRWQPGAPGADHFDSDGQLVESLTANGVTVQVSLLDTGWKLRANVAIANGSSRPVDVFPSLVALHEIAPNSKSLPYQDPAKLAKAMNHQILWTRSAAEEPGAAVLSAPHGSASAGKAYNASYPVSSYRPASGPNYLAQHQAAEQMARDNDFSGTVKKIKALALYNAAIAPRDKTAGAVWFERDANAQRLLLRVPVGDQVFEFPFSFERSK